MRSPCYAPWKPVRRDPPWGFTAFAIGNAIGLSMLSGGSVRYRLYARPGLGASEVAHMTVFASLALGCALPPLAALATLSNLPAASTYLHLPQMLLGGGRRRAVAVGDAVHRHLSPSPAGTTLPDNLLVKAGRRTLRLPGRRLTFLQLIITALDVAAAATVLYLLLPEAPPFGPSCWCTCWPWPLACSAMYRWCGCLRSDPAAAFADKLCRATGRRPAAVSLI
jgi:phosphatidylglycerol lysyltransferase